MSAWKVELGFRPELIRVRKFSLPEQGLGIDDRPWHYETFLRSPETDEPDESDSD